MPAIHAFPRFRHRHAWMPGLRPASRDSNDHRYFNACAGQARPSGISNGRIPHRAILTSMRPAPAMTVMPRRRPVSTRLQFAMMTTPRPNRPPAPPSRNSQSGKTEAEQAQDARFGNVFDRYKTVAAFHAGLFQDIEERGREK